MNIYGLNIPEVVGFRDANLPSIKANELRIDGVYDLSDGSVALIDFESVYVHRDVVIYLDYATRVIYKLLDEGCRFNQLPKIRIIIIYTADVKRERVKTSCDFGAVNIQFDAAFLSELPKDEIRANLEENLRTGKPLSDDELMQLILLPMAYEGDQKKQEMIREAVNIAKRIPEEDKQSFALSGLLVFCNKVIDPETYDDVRRMISMTKVGLFFADEIKQAQEQAREQERELTNASRMIDDINRCCSGFGVSVEETCQRWGYTMDQYNSAVALLQKAGRAVPATAAI